MTFLIRSLCYVLSQQTELTVKQRSLSGHRIWNKDQKACTIILGLTGNPKFPQNLFQKITCGQALWSGKERRKGKSKKKNTNKQQTNKQTQTKQK